MIVDEHSRRTNIEARPPGFVSGLLRLRRAPWEMVATILIGAGVVMLMQPLSIDLYGWSFAVILGGTAMFLVVSHFPD
ncbi:hypothetical protein [Flaviflagellibacter deserti]|uniref:Uncharacterized protein n=1 Tax=Flaviflagellibacter deserti TaxID=2267266 RepID=A0ABV9Z2M9_9HYPH